MSNSIKVILTIVTLISLSSTAAARSKHDKCLQKMEEAKGVAYEIGYAYYASTFDVAAAEKVGKKHLRRVCRNYCRGLKPRFGGKKITCRERINSDEQLDAILNRVNFEEELSKDRSEQMVEI